MPDVYLHALASARGSQIECNDAASLGQSSEECERIVRKTGVRSRPIAAPGEFTSDLAQMATSRLLAQGTPSAASIRFLVVCTQTPDHLIPGVSSKLHGALNFSQDCFVMDINQGCSGFVLGTQTMVGLLQRASPEATAVLVNADTYTRLVRKDDLTTRVLFGDAAVATMFTTKRSGFRVIDCQSYADGSGYDAFVANNSALMQETDVARGIHMDGPGILNFALRMVPASVNAMLEKHGLRTNQLRMLLFHQANSFVTQQLARKMGLASTQVPENCTHLGNTVSASIPLLLEEQLPLLKAGDLVLAAGFGVGLSWGTLLLERVEDQGIA